MKLGNRYAGSDRRLWRGRAAGAALLVAVVVAGAPGPERPARQIVVGLSSVVAAIAGEGLVLRLPAVALLYLAFRPPEVAPRVEPVSADAAVVVAQQRWGSILDEARRLAEVPLPVTEGSASPDLFEALDALARGSTLRSRVSISVLTDEGEPRAWSTAALDPQPDLLELDSHTDTGAVYRIRRTMAAVVLGVTAFHPDHVRTVDVVVEPRTPLASPLPPIFPPEELGGRTLALQFIDSTAVARSQEKLFDQRGEPFRSSTQGAGAVLYASLRDDQGNVLGIFGIPEAPPAPPVPRVPHQVPLRAVAIALALAIFARALGSQPERAAPWIFLLAALATALSVRSVPAAAVGAALASLALVLDAPRPGSPRALRALACGLFAAVALRALPKVLPVGPGMDALNSLDPVADFQELRSILVPAIAWGVAIVALALEASRGSVAVRAATVLIQLLALRQAGAPVALMPIALLPLLLGALPDNPVRARSSLARALLFITIASTGAAVGQLSALLSAPDALARWLVRDLRQRVEQLPRRRVQQLSFAAQQLRHSFEPAALAATGAGGDERAYALWLGSGLSEMGVDSGLGLFSDAGDLVGSFARQLPRGELSAWDEELDPESRRFAPFESFDRSVLRTGIATQLRLPRDSGIPGNVRLVVATDLASLRLPRAHRFAETLVARMNAEGRSVWSSNATSFRIDPAMAGAWDGSVAIETRIDGTRFLGVPVLVRDERLFLALRRPSRLHQVSSVLGAGLLGGLAAGSLVIAAFLLRRLDGPILARDDGTTGARSLLPRESLRTLRSYRIVLLGAFLVATLLPAQVLGFALDGIIRERFAALRVESARHTIDIARRTVAELFWGETVLVDADAKAELVSRLVDAPIDIYEGGQLVGSSRRQLVDVGLISRLLAPTAHVAVSLEGRPLYTWPGPSGSGSLTGRAATREPALLWAAAPVALGSAIRRGVVALPLVEDEGAVEEQLAAIGDAVRVVAFALLALSVGLSTTLAQGLSRPLIVLTEVAEALRQGRRSEIGPHPPRGTFHELVTLGEAMHRMAEQIHERERALLERNRYIETVLDNATPSVLSLDRSGIVRTANRSAKQLLGLPADALEAGSVELARHLEADPSLRLLAEALEIHRSSGRPVQRELEIARDDVLRLRASLLPFDDGGTIAILEDVSDVARANRIAAWAEMARSVAHEIKNPLTPIRLQTEHLRRVASVAKDVPADLRAAMAQATGVILDQVDALKRIAGEFSRFARPGEERMVSVDLAGILQRSTAAYGADATITVEAVVPPGLPAVRGVAGDLERAFKNLLQNAYESIQRLPLAEGRSIKVEAGVREGASGPKVVVDVTDSGAGVPAELRGRIFEPYFSTKDAGSGLGLALTRKILLEHGGDVRLLPSDRGAHFEVELPAA